MPYKDKDKQREAGRLRQQRRRDKIKSKGVTNQGVTQGVTDVEFTMLMAQADPHTKLRVSKPGDDDYDGLCTPEWIEAE